MGIDLDQFVESVPQEAICVACCLVLEEPIETFCGHHYCRSCWERHIGRSECASCSCIFCGALLERKEVKGSHVAWSVIQNMNVFCSYRSKGCDKIFKYSLREIHERTCPFLSGARSSNGIDISSAHCPSCKLTVVQSDSVESHDCVSALQGKLKECSVHLTNLDLEKSRVAFKFMLREKALLDRLAELEVQHHFESLNKHNEIRELQAKVAGLRGDLGMPSDQNSVLTLNIDLYRVNGSLGFNIIGGACKEDSICKSHDRQPYKDGESSGVGSSSAGIFVSRVSPGGAADQPGKLKLHDQIIQVDGVDLRNATHEVAVQAFRRSGDPVKIVVQRHTSKVVAAPSTRDAMTQVGGRMFVVTGPGEALDDLGEKQTNGELVYDSGFDTLLTHKSSRSSRASTFTENSDGENISKSVSSEPSSNDGLSITESKPPEYLESRNGKVNGFYTNSTRDVSEAIVPQLSKAWIDDVTEDDQEMDFEFEYEEVLLAKLDGKFGLLLCYGGDVEDVSVYVGDIEENSVADLCGQIVVGDQIVKINECQVNDVEEAYRMLRDNENIKLVVARPVYDALWQNYDDAPETDLDLDYLESIKEEPLTPVEEISSHGSARSDKSGTSSEASCSITPTRSPAKASGSLRQADRARALSEPVHAASERVRVASGPANEVFNSGSSSLLRSNTDSSKPRQVSDSNNNPCSAKDASSKFSSQAKQSGLSENRRPQRSSDGSGIQDRSEGRRSRSGSKSSSNRSKNSDNDCSSLQKKRTSNDSNNSNDRIPPSSAPVSSSLRSALKNDHRGSRESRTQKHVIIDPHPGWNDTERKVWEEFKLIQRLEAEEKDQGGNTDIEASWRVRRSKDGNHVYIKKTNTNRSKLLKERAKQIKEERSGITTDDDAFTVYQGRYWSRDDRRRQLIRHQEKKRRLLQKLNEKSLIDHSVERTMAETVQRNMTLPGRGFDDFLTVAEILAQRNRAGIFGGPIQVTTI